MYIGRFQVCDLANLTALAAVGGFASHLCWCLLIAYAQALHLLNQLIMSAEVLRLGFKDQDGQACSLQYRHGGVDSCCCPLPGLGGKQF